MNDAIRAGVASIEHGSLIDDEGVALMKEHGTFLVPTLYTLDFIIDEGPESGVPEYAVEKAKAMAKQQRERLAKAYHAGVRFAYGTDAAVFPHGRNAKDFQILVEELDVQPIDAIRMADRERGRAHRDPGPGWDVGAGEVGRHHRRRGQPSGERPGSSKDVRFVMKGGVVYKSKIE